MLSHSEAPNTRLVLTVPGNKEIREVLRHLHKICKRTRPRLALARQCNGPFLELSLQGY